MKSQQGFTFIEVIIVVALLSVLMLGLMSMFDWHSKVFYLEQADTRAAESVRITMNNMTKYVAQGIQFTNSRTVNAVTYTTDADTLVVQIPSIDSSGNLITGTYDYVIYYVSNGKLYQLIDKGAGSNRDAGTKLMANDVHSFALTYDSGDVTTASMVTVSMQVRTISRGTSYVAANVSDTIFLRNQ